ncbi:unnamed protein product [Coregonus sp. 'balchen']|nr:unnamed protein product [Coregonus sp. 'balchen']
MDLGLAHKVIKVADPVLGSWHLKIHINFKRGLDSLQQALHQSVFLSAMSAQPGRDLPLISNGNNEKITHPCNGVADFIHSLPGCDEQANQFKEEQIDGKALLLLTQRDIVKIMSVKLGPALKIYNSILMFKHAENNQSAADNANT